MSSSDSNSNSNSTASANQFDSRLLKSLMEKLQISPASAPTDNRSSSSSSLDELLAELLDESDEDDDTPNPKESPEERHRARALKEELELERELIRMIHSGKTESLKVNSGQAVSINEHYVCVTSRKERDGEYRAWEWHGHIMLFNERGEFSPEYFYGNYFERLPEKSAFNLWYEKTGELVVEVDDDEEEDQQERLDLGLRGLISGLNCTNGDRIVHRNVNADSQRFL